MSVKRNKEYRGIVFEYILCAIAVVDVPVEDEYFLMRVIALEVSRCDRNVVEEAESRADLCVARMMAWWSEETECVLPCFRDDSIDGFDDSAYA